jgi:hypothetical protein
MILQASTVILGTMNPSRLGFSTRNRPETLAAIAEYQDVRLRWFRWYEPRAEVLD